LIYYNGKELTKFNVYAAAGWILGIVRRHMGLERSIFTRPRKPKEKFAKERQHDRIWWRR
jgi:hypothetical protein